jgi:hypothetical protein
VKIGCLGTVGVDKRQRAVKTRHIAVLEAEMEYIDVSVFNTNFYGTV